MFPSGILCTCVQHRSFRRFASYLIWFKLIHTYPVAGLSVFTFLTPIFGVASGIIFLKETLTKGLVVGLACVCLGIYGTNYGSSREG